MNKGILAFRELPLNRGLLPQSLFNESACMGMMELISYPVFGAEAGSQANMGDGIGRINFGSTYIPYYHYTKCLYVSPENNFGNIHGIIWDKGYRTKEEAYQDLTDLLLAYNRGRSNNTLYPEDVFERLS
jgi:hypothetical protein